MTWPLVGQWSKNQMRFLKFDFLSELFIFPFFQNTVTGSCFHTAPQNGIYRLCFHARWHFLTILFNSIFVFRFRQGGNAGDVTVTAGGTTYAAAFGDGDQRDWRSTGQCFYQVTNGKKCAFFITKDYCSNFLPPTQSTWAWGAAGAAIACRRRAGDTGSSLSHWSFLWHNFLISVSKMII